MLDATVWTTMISVTGAGASALGAVVITNHGTLRRDRQQQEQKETERSWAERSARDTERREAWGRLLRSAGRVKAGIMMLCEGYQADLEERERALREDAVTVAEEASSVIVLYAGDPDGVEIAATAQEMAAATSQLVAALHKTISRLPGSPSEVVGEVSFAEFDTRLIDLQRALGSAITSGDLLFGGSLTSSADGPTSTVPFQRTRIWSKRRDASSR
jgi:hypothetical protein